MKSEAIQAYPDPSPNFDLYRLSVMDRVLCAWESRKVLSRRRREGGNVNIFPLRESIRPLQPDDIPLIFLTHNDRRFLPSFLKHYRELGVTRFICVDDQSTDGTRELLIAEPDVDVFGSDVRYRDARRGRLWREALFAMYGENRWYLNVDSDEYLVYQDCEIRALPEFISALEKRGIERCPAPMIDLYPNRDLQTAHFDGSTDQMPWEVAPLLDGSGYRLTMDKRALTLRGGMRARLFNVEAELMKYPLLFWRKGYSLGISIHQPAPYHLNFAPIYGVLLHFKFFSDTAERAREAVKDGQYFSGASEYKKIVRFMESNVHSSIESRASIRYCGSEDLSDRGFFVPIFS